MASRGLKIWNCTARTKIGECATLRGHSLTGQGMTGHESAWTNFTVRVFNVWCFLQVRLSAVDHWWVIIVLHVTCSGVLGSSLNAEAVVYLAFARSFSGLESVEVWLCVFASQLFVPTIADDSFLNSFCLQLHIFADQVSNVYTHEIILNKLELNQVNGTPGPPNYT